MGIRQGGKLSPLLCNILLDKVDKKFRELEKDICPYVSKSSLLYVRYADNFIFLCDTSLSKARELKDKLVFYLENILNLKLNIGNTKVRDIRKGFKFLGFFFIIRGNVLAIYLDIPKVFQFLSYLGFCNREGFPIEHGGFMHKTQAEINLIMIFILNELKNWFFIARNRKQGLDAVNYVITYSLAKTYAAKFKLKTVRRTLAISGKEFNKPLKAADKRRAL